MKYVLILGIILFCIGCGGDTTGSGQTIITGITPEPEETNNEQTTGEPLTNTNTADSNEVVGQWTMSSSSAGSGNSTNQKLTFTTDGRVTWTSTQGSESGTYTINGQSFNISFWGDHTHTINATTLTLRSTSNTNIWSSWNRQN